MSITILPHTLAGVAVGSTQVYLVLVFMWYVLLLYHKCHGAKNGIVLVLTSKLLTLLCGWSKVSWFQFRGRYLLESSVGIGIYLALCEGRKWLGLGSGSKLNWFLCRGPSKLTCFQSGDQNWLDISVRVEVNLDFVSGIEIDLVLVWSKLTCFVCGPKLTFF